MEKSSATAHSLLTNAEPVKMKSWAEVSKQDTVRIMRHPSLSCAPRNEATALSVAFAS